VRRCEIEEACWCAVCVLVFDLEDLDLHAWICILDEDFFLRRDWLSDDQLWREVLDDFLA
jgi:hypothetical protein